MAAVGGLLNYIELTQKNIPNISEIELIDKKILCRLICFQCEVLKFLQKAKRIKKE